MPPTTRTRLAAAATLVALAALTITAPALAGAPLTTTDAETSLRCDAVTGSAGTVQLRAAVNDTTGASGFLQYWQAPADPTSSQPTLVSGAMTATIDANGVLTASFDMYLTGDLGIESESEPVFVGVATLTATTAAGATETTQEAFRIGNQRLTMRRATQALYLTDGAVSVPTAGTFDLAAGCEASTDTVDIFAIQPDALVSTGALIEVGCFADTTLGTVIVSGQAGTNETFLAVLVLGATDVYFGMATDATISLRGVNGAVPLALDSDAGVTGLATVSARFHVVERTKDRLALPTGWATETAYAFSVEGTLSLDLPGGSLELPMDGCVAGGQVGMGLERGV